MKIYQTPFIIHVRDDKIILLDSYRPFLKCTPKILGPTLSQTGNKMTTIIYMLTWFLNMNGANATGGKHEML